MYQSKQTENVSDNSVTTDNAENTQSMQSDFTVTEQSKTAESVKHLQRKQADKFRAAKILENSTEISTEKSVHISVTENTEIQSDISPPIRKDERYNFQEVASESKQVFDIVNKNTDFRLGRQDEIPKGTGNAVNAKNNKNRLYQKERKNIVETEQSVSSEQTSEPKAENSDNAELPDNSDSIESVNTDFEFDRTAKYERRAEKLYQKSEQPQKETSSNNGFLLVMLLLVGAAGIGVYYFKVLLPKKKLEAAGDIEDFEFEEYDEDEETEIEDSEDETEE